MTSSPSLQGVLVKTCRADFILDVDQKTTLYENLLDHWGDYYLNWDIDYISETSRQSIKYRSVKITFDQILKLNCILRGVQLIVIALIIYEFRPAKFVVIGLVTWSTRKAYPSNMPAIAVNFAWEQREYMWMGIVCKLLLLLLEYMRIEFVIKASCQLSYER